MQAFLRQAVGKPILWWQQKALSRFLSEARHLEKYQQHALKTCLQTVAGSRFAKYFYVRADLTPDTLRQSCPILQYDTVAPYMEALRHGDQSALLNPQSKLHGFALSSGTTGAFKHLPVTTAHMALWRRTWNLWGAAAIGAFPSILSGSIASFAGSLKAQNRSGLPYGSITGLLRQDMHHRSALLQAVPASILAIEAETQRQLALITCLLLQEDLQLFIAANPSTLLQLYSDLKKNWSTVMNFLSDPEHTLPTAAKKFLLQLRQQRKTRYRYLQNCAAAPLPSELWPHLKVLGVWTGGPSQLYLPALRELFPQTVIWDHGLSASEGRFTIPLSHQDRGGLLAYDGIFFEFVPVGDHTCSGPLSPDQPTLLAHQLERGKTYRLIVTTPSGLLRYDMHDLVEVTGFAAATPYLSFVGKAAHVANFTGEKITAAQVAKALVMSQERLQQNVGEIALLPTWGEPPHYQLLVEPTSEYPAARFSVTMDDMLRTCNYEYDAKRKSGRLGALTVKTVQPGTWQRLKEKRLEVSQGAREQYKHPLIIQDFHLVKELHSEV